MKNFLVFGIILSLCVVLFASGEIELPSSRTASNSDQEVKSTPYTGEIYLGRGGVLFVEDPAGGYGPAIKPDGKWIEVLDSTLGVGNYGWFGATTTAAEDGPSVDTMLNYDLVIWNTYDHWNTPVLTSNDMTNIASYLSQGGKVWLIGQDLLYSGVPLSWLTSEFLLASAIEDYIPAGTPTINLSGTNELSGFAFSSTTDYDLNDFYPDALTPATGAHGVVIDADSSYTVGIIKDDFTASFWTVDGRTTSPYIQWEMMVNEMFNLFSVLGVEETPINIGSGFVVREINSFTSNPGICLSTPEAVNVRVEIFDVTGRSCAVLFDGSFQGERVFSYSTTSSGTYIYRITANESVVTGKLISAY